MPLTAVGIPDAVEQMNRSFVRRLSSVVAMEKLKVFPQSRQVYRVATNMNNPGLQRTIWTPSTTAEATSAVIYPPPSRGGRVSGTGGKTFQDQESSVCDCPTSLSQREPDDGKYVEKRMI